MLNETITIDKQEKRAIKFPEYIHCWHKGHDETIKLSFDSQSLHAGDYYAARHDAGLERKGCIEELWDCLFISGRLEKQFTKMQIYRRKYLFLDFGIGAGFLPTQLRDAAGNLLAKIDKPWRALDETLRLCAKYSVHLLWVPPTGGTRSGELIARALFCE